MMPRLPAIRSAAGVLSWLGLGLAVSSMLSSAPSIPPASRAIFDTERAVGEPMPATDVANGVVAPPGFTTTVFAAEPDVRQPIAMATDARGRLWVAENYTYSERSIGWHGEFRDRIVILEDTDNDGRHDKRTVFWDQAERLTSIEIGFGGVWAICLPNLVFIPDRNADDVPDSPPEILLDGFEFNRARHTVANGLRWGPDGWLYGRQGILAWSNVGRPGSTDEERTPTNAGIWRYHPLRRTFELVAVGTTNPWGMDWDPHGELFFINTVIGHLWHAIPGAHFRRMSGDDPTPRIYEPIEQHADHVHWATNEDWTEVRKGVSGATLAAGGGHAHTGLLFYQGGQWPESWRGRLLTINFHGRRFNIERLEREGSALLARHDRDTFEFPDPRFRGLDLLAAPDGGVFVSDWNDDGECHDHDGVHRSSGRIFKIVHGRPPPKPIDLTRLDVEALCELQASPNDWLARQARGLLAERAAAGADLAAARQALSRVLGQNADTVVRLRSLWALQVIGAVTPELLLTLIDDPEAPVRVWALRLATDDRARPPTDALLAAFQRLAQHDPSPQVRLALASTLQRLDHPQRVGIARALLSHGQDANDHNLPLMLWYGIEPLAGASIEGFSFVEMLASARIPRVQRLGARRLAEELDQQLDRVAKLLESVAHGPLATRQAVLDGLAQGLAGRHRAPKPANWDSLQPSLGADGDEVLSRRLRDLSAIFGDGRAFAEMRAVALDTKLDDAQRRAGIAALAAARAPELREVGLRLIKVRGLTAAAATGLAALDDPAIADALISEWPAMYGMERPPVLDVLFSRPLWAEKTLAAVRAGVISKSSLTPSHARQLRSLGDPNLVRQWEESFGSGPDERPADQILVKEAWRSRLGPEILARADLKNGRKVYRQLCSACHVLNGEGGHLGPDLTGAARDNLDYLLENVLFPSATLSDGYRLTTLRLKDGRVLSGMGRERTAQTLKLQTPTDLIALAVSDIETEETLPVSLMPAGLLDAVPTTEVSDLVAYLMQR